MCIGIGIITESRKKHLCIMASDILDVGDFDDVGLHCIMSWGDIPDVVYAYAYLAIFYSANSENDLIDIDYNYKEVKKR